MLKVLRFELMINVVCVEAAASSRRRRKHSMKHYAALDVAVKETAVCIVDETGSDLPRGEGGDSP